jgi:uncharacterized caspase-like protein
MSFLQGVSGMTKATGVKLIALLSVLIPYWLFGNAGLVVDLKSKGPRKTYAVVIGINYADRPGFAMLLSPEREATAIFTVLTDTSTGLATPSSSVLLLGSAATHRAVVEAIVSRRDQLKEDEALIIYFAGYSRFSDLDQEVYLFPYDGHAANGGRDGIALSREILDSAPKNADLIFIGDGCRIGTNFTDRIGQRNPRVGVLAASKSDEMAFELEDGSPFANALQKLLSSPLADLDGDGFISLEEAYVGIYAQVLRSSQGLQHPSASGPRIHRLMLARAPLSKQALEFDSPVPEDLATADELVINDKPIKVDTAHSSAKELILLGDANGVVGKGLTYLSTKKQQYLYWREEQRLQDFQSPYKKSYAVLVAIDDYDRTKDPLHRGKTGYEPRGSMVAKAEELRETLTRLGFANSNIISLYDEKATSDAIEKTLKSFWAGGARADADRVFFYFGGHGDTSNGSGILITYDFDPVRPTLTGFLMRDLATRHSENMAARHVLFTIDSCAAGLAVLKTLGDKGLTSDPRRFQQLSIIRNDTAPRARNFLVAGTEDHPALWDNGGVFTQALIAGLKGAADLNNDRLIQFYELAMYVSNEVANRASEKGVRQEVQPYVLDAMGTGKIVFLEDRSQ